MKDLNELRADMLEREMRLKAGFRETFAMDNGIANHVTDNRGHEMIEFNYSSDLDFQDANGASYDVTDSRWVC